MSQEAGGIRASAFARALAILGDAWTILLVKEAFLGTRRFQGFQERLGVPRQTLALRLNDLAGQQIFYKRPAQHRTLVFEYHLTPKGLDLYPFILAVWRWHRRWNPERSFLPATLLHRPCGQPLEPVLACRACAGPVRLEDVTAEPGPGAGSDPRPPARLARQNDGALAKALDMTDPEPVATFLVGDRWANLVLHAVLTGRSGFHQIQGDLAISSNILSARLKKLLALGLVEGAPGADRRRLHYRPTERGRDVYPMIQTLSAWGDRWLAGAAGPPEIARHSCGAILDARMLCGHCRAVVRAWEVASG
ncbi:MAG: helix-turn-helix domain-containing protein [Thalassobaculales bacterium]